MKESVLISVIIPVYNVQNYLVRCLDSVINQTYKNLEIILVNDGSTDNSLEICQQYIDKDSRIILINKNNGGLSSARNAGLEINKGKYITFIDSDDWVALDYINTLYQNIIDNNADISIVGFENVYDSNVEDIPNTNKIKTFSQKEAVNKLILNKLETSACGKLFNSFFFKKNRFREGIIFEDLEVMYKLFLSANKIVRNSSIKYFYFQRKSSIMGTAKNIKNIVKTSDTYIDIFVSQNKFLIEKDFCLSDAVYIYQASVLYKYYLACSCCVFNKAVFAQRKKISNVINKLFKNITNTNKGKFFMYVNIVKILLTKVLKRHR
ncbi:glycosyltransferase family 2 protein [Candidatus Francisella endociliophora]|uniref:glycosyltransferase family 2 protein n=1 Tax=Candidatus Francisella endociliophora TaxID=653937 RepID=UPI000693BEB0|nr:glycosyltransferase family 2 protein [Francisella sp. FSC1006]